MRRGSELLRRIALEEGFDLAGIAAADRSAHGDFLEGWIAAGRQGEMAYLARPDAVARRRELALTLPGVKSVLVVAHRYGGVKEETGDPTRGVIARYARGRDYHKVLGRRLERVRRRFEEALGTPVPGRVYVDTGPILERELAQRAGLGWFGRNTMLIHPRRGSYFFIGVLLLEIELEPSPPFEKDHCGSCRACLDACPTGALLGRDASGAPVMDARLCISYLTIEHRGPIPRELRPAIGNRIFGCDICQEVCPFNERFGAGEGDPAYASRGPGEAPWGVEPSHSDIAAPRVWLRRALRGSAETRSVRPSQPLSAGPSQRRSAQRSQTRSPDAPSAPPHPGTAAPALLDLLAMDRDMWESFSRGSPIRRAGLAGFRRNVVVAIGNWIRAAERPPPEAIEALTRALADPEPLVRSHAAWALGETDAAAAQVALTARLGEETDGSVREEMERALGR